MVSLFVFVFASFALEAICAYSPLISNSINNQKLKHILSEFLSYPDHGLLNPIHISENEPFIFIHQRKTGGMDIRDELANAATKMGLSQNIACYTIDCDTYHIVRHDNEIRYNISRASWDKPPSPTYAINAGHFSWSETNNFRRHTDFDIYGDSKFSCATVFRHPVNRIVSCVMFRFGPYLKQRGIKAFKNIPLDMLNSILARATDAFGTSCLNEPFRMLSGFADENIINGLSITHNSSFSVFAMQQTLRHTLRCNPAVLEIPDSFILLQRKFPQLAAAFNTSYRGGGVLAEGDRLEVVEKYSYLEHLLYETILKKITTRVRQLAA